MPGWEVSRHPEWEQMYAAGITVRKISDRVSHPGSTVHLHLHLHLQVRELYMPGLRSIHEAALAAHTSDWPDTHWRQNYKVVQDFRRLNGKLPESDGDPGEATSAAWMARQRSLHNQGKIPAFKVTLMDTLPGWDAAPVQLKLNAHWRERLVQLQSFVAEHGELPHYKHHTTEHEHTLGVWLHTQHQSRAEGRLSDWRHAAMDATLSGWHSRM